MPYQMNLIRDKAYKYLKAGDARGAMVMLLSKLTEVNGRCGQFADPGIDPGDLRNDLVLPLVESILSSNLEKVEGRRLSYEIEPVIEELSANGIENLDVILVALNNGWSDDFFDEQEDYNYDKTILNEAKLNSLERQGRAEEYLNLSLVTRQYLHYIQKQIELKEFDKALNIALITLTQANDALLVARALYEVGYLPGAQRLGEKGLSMEGGKHELVAWLGPIEATQGQIGKEIQAYMVEFANEPSLDLYNSIKLICGEDWMRIRPDLIQVIMAPEQASILVDIYLFESEWDLAIGVADQYGGRNDLLLDNVAEKVLPYRPDWVIRVSRKQIEWLIAKKQFKYFPGITRWLARMKQAYLNTHRLSEWSTYLDGLKTAYSHRRALQDIFNQL